MRRCKPSALERKYTHTFHAWSLYIFGIKVEKKPSKTYVFILKVFVFILFRPKFRLKTVEDFFFGLDIVLAQIQYVKTKKVFVFTRVAFRGAFGLRHPPLVVCTLQGVAQNKIILKIFVLLQN